ncbi:MAG: thioesterase family protein [Saprospiraceae bacterium]|nr:thioesterase family protein [Saprospiraceae bacterium]
MSDLLKDFKSIFETKVAWGRQDAAQHVNNIMYLRYAESARIQYMDDIGLGFHKGSDNIIWRIPL